MKLIFEFARIAAFCFAGEVCHLVLPLPIPASVYGLMLLLAALRFGVVKARKSYNSRKNGGSNWNRCARRRCF